MKTALVTGATGFIGSHVVRGLLRKKFEVHVLCRPQSNFQRLADVREQLTAHTVPLGNRAGLRRLVQTVRPHYVLHLAAATMHGGVSPSAEALVRTNLLGTLSLIAACDDIEYACFVNTGDAFEYGPGRRPLKESRRCRPTTLDGITKFAATQYAQQVARQRQKPLITLRLFSVFGPQDDPHRLVPRLIAGALRGTPLLLSRPRIARDYLYVEDLVGLYLKVLRSGARLAGAVLNAGSGRQTTIEQIVDMVLAITGSRSEVRWGAYPAAAHDGETYVADMTRTGALVSWQPRISIDRGLAATIRSAEEVGYDGALDA